MNQITDELLRLISGIKSGEMKGAYNIREDGQCAARQSSENILIESKTDAPGLVIHIKPGTKGETVYIPACVTHAGVDDLVYNDFYVGEGADVIIEAGCGVHSEGEEEARHNGIHRFLLAKGPMCSIRKSTSPPATARATRSSTRSPTSSWPRTRALRWTPCSWAA